MGATWGDFADLGDVWVRWTIRVALVGWFLTLAGRLAVPDRDRLLRWTWTLGWLVYVVHVLAAFHYAHGWSHAEAVAHVERRSGFGPGIFVSHAFTLAWTADVARWWLAPAARTGWLDRLLLGFMAFVTFNATVVYETGPIRWAGAAGFTLLALLLVRGRSC